jgi:hypothetical protein
VVGPPRLRYHAGVLPGACLVLLALAGVPLEGGNVHLARARAEVDRLQYAAARTSLERALKAGGSTPAETREILLLSAEVAATLGDHSAAERAYRQLLALDPRAQLPPGTSPKLVRPFAAARAAMRGRGGLVVRQEHAGGARPTVTLVVTRDPLRQVAGARLRCRTESGTTSVRTATGTRRITLPVPHAGRVEVVLSALDRHGNRLVDLAPVEVTGPVADAGPAGAGLGAPGDATHSRGPPAGPLFPRWILWTAAATTLFVASGITFGVLADDTQNEIIRMQDSSRGHYYSDLLAARRRGDWEAIVTNVSFGVAAAGALVIGSYYLWRLHRRTRTQVIAAPVRAGALLHLATTF